MEAARLRIVRDLAWLIASACALRLLLFSGFVLGDDPAYGDLTHYLLSHGYPPVEGLNVFATRPLLLAAIAASVKFFGWTELAFVLPVLISSLTCVTSAYVIGALLGDRPTAIAAAVTLSLLPLDAVFATTMANDIMASALIAAGAALAIAAAGGGIRSTRRGCALAATGGVLIGLSAAVKLASAAIAIPMIGVLVVLIVRRKAPTVRLMAVAAGWAAAHIAIAVFFRIAGGNWFQHVRVEWAFNRKNLLPAYLSSPSGALLSYPKWMFGIELVGPVNHPFFPYGLFFPAAAIALVVLVRSKAVRMWVAGAWFVAMLLVLEFWPLQLFPAYAPIHRLPRFLHAVAVPGAVLIGSAFVQAMRRQGVARAAALTFGAAYIGASLSGSLAAAAHHRDTMIDQRFAAALALAYPGSVAADDELLNYLRFRSGYERPERFVAVEPPRFLGLPDRALFFAGGARRIDLDPRYVVAHYPPSIPSTWVKIATLPGAPAPWRLLPGVAYVASGSDGDRRAAAPRLVAACPAGVSWQLRDAIDVGNTESERTHGYEIAGPVWSGVRVMPLPDAGQWMDDGRAFAVSQSFDVPGLESADTCVAVLIDARVRNQVTRWFIGTEEAGTVDAGQLSADGGWQIKAFIIPARLVRHGTNRLRETFVSSSSDINAFRVEVYQAGSRWP